jgi:hypothetical protein
METLGGMIQVGRCAELQSKKEACAILGEQLVITPTAGRQIQEVCRVNSWDLKTVVVEITARISVPAGVGSVECLPQFGEALTFTVSPGIKLEEGGAGMAFSAAPVHTVDIAGTSQQMMICNLRLNETESGQVEQLHLQGVLDKNKQGPEVLVKYLGKKALR